MALADDEIEVAVAIEVDEGRLGRGLDGGNAGERIARRRSAAVKAGRPSAFEVVAVGVGHVQRQDPARASARRSRLA